MVPLSCAGNFPAPGIWHYRAAGDRFPRFEIEGRRYGVETACEFPFLPDEEGASWVLRLVALEPPPN